MISEGRRLLVTAKYHGIFFFTKKKDEGEQKSEVEPSLLCKFVVDGTGRRIGESVSVNDDVLIIKTGSQFLGVPMKHIDAGGKTLVVKGLIDYSKAYAMGEKWRKESYREMDAHEKPAHRL